MDTVKELQEVTDIDAINLTLVGLQSQLDDWLADDTNHDNKLYDGLDAVCFILILFQEWQKTDLSVDFHDFVESHEDNLIG